MCGRSIDCLRAGQRFIELDKYNLNAEISLYKNALFVVFLVQSGGVHGVNSSGCLPIRSGAACFIKLSLT